MIMDTEELRNMPRKKLPGMYLDQIQNIIEKDRIVGGLQTVIGCAHPNKKLKAITRFIKKLFICQEWRTGTKVNNSAASRCYTTGIKSSKLRAIQPIWSVQYQRKGLHDIYMVELRLVKLYDRKARYDYSTAISIIGTRSNIERKLRYIHKALIPYSNIQWHRKKIAKHWRYYGMYRDGHRTIKEVCRALMIKDGVVTDGESLLDWVKIKLEWHKEFIHYNVSRCPQETHNK